jgi:hypothetical protein
MPVIIAVILYQCDTAAHIAPKHACRLLPQPTLVENINHRMSPPSHVSHLAMLTKARRLGKLYSCLGEGRFEGKARHMSRPSAFRNPPCSTKFFYALYQHIRIVLFLLRSLFCQELHCNVLEFSCHNNVFFCSNSLSGILD